MDDRKMEVIAQLMDELKELMQPSAEEIGERLGKPKVEVVSMESDEPMDGDIAMDGELEGPDEKLKERLAKLRG